MKTERLTALSLFLLGLDKKAPFNFLNPRICAIGYCTRLFPSLAQFGEHDQPGRLDEDGREIVAFRARSVDDAEYQRYIQNHRGSKKLKWAKTWHHCDPLNVPCWLFDMPYRCAYYLFLPGFQNRLSPLLGNVYGNAPAWKVGRMIAGFVDRWKEQKIALPDKETFGQVIRRPQLASVLHHL